VKVWLVFEEYYIPYVASEKKLIAVFSEEGLANELAAKETSRSVEDWDVQGPSNKEKE
jgi:hypothetical protein